MKNQKYHTVRTVPECNRQKVERGKLTLSSQSRISTGTRGVKLVHLVNLYQISISPFYVIFLLSPITDKTFNGLYYVYMSNTAGVL